MPSKWQNGTGDESCHVSVPRIQCAVQLKISPAGLQAVSHREREGLFMGFWFSEEKHETVRNDRDVRVLDNGKQRMGSRGERAFGILAAVLHPSLTHTDL